MNNYKISKEAYNNIINYVKTTPKYETCGFILKDHKNTHSTIFEPITNISDYAKEVDYIMEPKEMMKVFMSSYKVGNNIFNKKADRDVTAIFHSHPNNKGIPSSIDLARVSYDVIYLIYGFTDNILRAWKYNKNNNDFDNIKIEVE